MIFTALSPVEGSMTDLSDLTSYIDEDVGKDVRTFIALRGLLLSFASAVHRAASPTCACPL